MGQGNGSPGSCREHVNSSISEPIQNEPWVVKAEDPGRFSGNEVSQSLYVKIYVEAKQTKQQQKECGAFAAVAVMMIIARQ